MALFLNSWWEEAKVRSLIWFGSIFQNREEGMDTPDSIDNILQETQHVNIKE